MKNKPSTKENQVIQIWFNDHQRSFDGLTMDEPRLDPDYSDDYIILVKTIFNSEPRFVEWNSDNLRWEFMDNMEPDKSITIWNPDSFTEAQEQAAWADRKKELEKKYDMVAIAKDCLCSTQVGLEFNYVEPDSIALQHMNIPGDDTEDIDEYLVETYSIPRGDTDYLDLDKEELYPIQSYDDLLTKIINLNKIDDEQEN